ncbi:MAG: tRNA uridine-5-carboxymethylaminomethyl(34) synthesis GTPase MnmE [Verrucomicrobiae bacterium]|nr:tRNA uridine-5-carboxymethylaminomethyl(34) synthesis GTPase MnmE [Verrucomicrobiae bacterium]
MTSDTIAAISTPLGEGGLAVIRISGPDALAVAEKCFEPLGKHSKKPSEAQTHTIHYGRIVRNGQTVDEVLLAVMRAPRTYTREDVVEISCHGGLIPAKMVLETVLQSGARLAEPGEFTKRAFLNGRLDLAQAEAVIDLIHARTELAARAATEQLAGRLSRRINQLRDEFLLALAHVEAQLDFPDEDIAPATAAELMAKLETGLREIEQLLRTADEGRILRRGVRTVIVGRPNVGKSSLLNQLLGRDRAIVSHIPGTTRDTIEETANIRGLPVVLIDTAGLRDAQDHVEQEGVKRTRTAVELAELVIHVLDGSEELTQADVLYLTEFAAKKRILVINKTDLPRRLTIPTHLLQPALSNRTPSAPTPAPTPVVEVSCVTGAGIELLKDAIKEAVWSGEISAEMIEVAINARHQQALIRARAGIAQAAESLKTGRGLELVAIDLRDAINALGEITGKTVTEDLLDVIFSQFCIGK